MESFLPPEVHLTARSSVNKDTSNSFVVIKTSSAFYPPFLVYFLHGDPLIYGECCASGEEN